MCFAADSRALARAFRESGRHICLGPLASERAAVAYLEVPVVPEHAG